MVTMLGAQLIFFIDCMVGLANREEKVKHFFGQPNVITHQGNKTHELNKKRLNK